MNVNNDYANDGRLGSEYTIQLNILSLNTCGLKSKSICPEFISFISDYDIIGIQESKLDDVDIISITNYKIFTNNRKQISRHRSGGIALLVHENVLPYVRVLNHTSKLILWFSISKKLLLLDDDLICGVVYVPPHGSKYAHPDPYLEIQSEFDQVCLNSRHVLLFGDFNARSAKLADYTDGDKFIFDILGDESLSMEREETFRNFESAGIPIERSSADPKTNAYGYQLTDFCKNNNVFILNGRLDYHEPKLTCKNSSTVDYFVSTAFNFDLLSTITTHEFDALLSDAHCPVSLTLNPINTCEKRDGSSEHRKNEPNVRLWNPDKKDSFGQNLNYGEILKISSYLDVMTSGYNVSTESVNNIINQIEKLFLTASESSFGYTPPKKKSTETNKITHTKPWFNRKCHEARNLYHNTRKLYNKYKTQHYKDSLKRISKNYKQVLTKNAQKHKNEKVSKLRNLKYAKPREFWKIINSINNDSKSTEAPLQDLYDYFKNINSTSPNEENTDDQHSRTEQPDHRINMEINQPITESEICIAVKKLKNNKSHGSDKILNEHLKSTINVMAPIYAKLFNIIFDTGIVPESWTLGDILPIYKNKGNKHSPENYRPITLLSCFGKLFTSILNSRITKFIEETDGIDACQAGFRKGFSTADNLFILQNLIEFSKVNKFKLFCAFIDFKQAFDTVWRNGLWQKLACSNINGKCLNFIKNMYENIKSRISTPEGASAFFPCLNGVRQGENLSPLLFSVYLNDLQAYLDRNHVKGVSWDVNNEHMMTYLKILVLLFADDTVIFATNKDDLQVALNVFEHYCDQ